MLSYNHLSNGNTPSSDLSRSEDGLEVLSLESADVGILPSTSQEVGLVHVDDHFLNSVSSEESKLGEQQFQDLQDLQQIFQASGSFTQKDRDEAVFEKRKNADLISFIQSMGLTIQDVNSFVHDSIIPKVSKCKSDSDLGKVDSVESNGVPNDVTVPVQSPARPSHAPGLSLEVLNALEATAYGSNILGSDIDVQAGERLEVGELPPSVSEDFVGKVETPINPAPRSWCSLVANEGQTQNLNLTFFPPSMDNGSVIIKPPP